MLRPWAWALCAVGGLLIAGSSSPLLEGGEVWPHPSGGAALVLSLPFRVFPRLEITSSKHYLFFGLFV